MNFDFSDDQQAIKRTAKDLLAARFTTEHVRELAEAEEYDMEAWKEICELGWPGIFIAEDHGGQGLGAVELIILMEELGYALAPLPFLSNAAAGLVLHGQSADVIVLIEDGDTGSVVEASAAEVEPLETIDATRRFARVRANGGEPLAGAPRGAMDRVAAAVAAE